MSDDKISKIHSWKRIIKSNHFGSSFSIILICITIFFIISSVFTFFQNFNRLKTSMELKANQGAISIQDELNSMKNSTIFIGNLSSVGSILNTKEPSLDQLSAIIKDVAPFFKLYQYSSISLFFPASQRIYDSTSGMYTFTDYFSPDFLKTLKSMTSYEMWLVDVPYRRYYQDAPTQVLTYIRKLPIHETVCKGYAVISISMDTLSSMARKINTEFPYTVATYYKDKLLWCSSEDILKTWNQDKGRLNNEVSFFNHYYQYSSTADIDVEWVIYLTRSDIQKAILPDFIQGLLLYSLSIIVAFGVAVIYSILMLRRVDAIIEKICEYPYASTTNLDEFSLLNMAIDNMKTQLIDIHYVMNQNKELIRERLLSGILYNHVAWNNLSPEYKQNGISFPHPHLAVILISIPDLDKINDYMRREQLMLVVRNNATDAFSFLGQVYSLYLESNIISILLNTSHYDSLPSEFHKICSALKIGLKQTMSLYPLFSIGICSPSDPKPFQSWSLALKNFIFTATNSDDYIFIGYQSEYVSSINSELLDSLVHSIVDKDFIRLKKLTENFSNHYLNNNTELADAQRFTVISVCRILASLLELNIDIQNSQIISCIKKITKATSCHDCSKLFFICLSNLAHSDGKVSDESHSYIRDAIKYIETHYSEPISIPQIADSIGVSSIYLNKVFKLSTGKTLSEFLNIYRINHSLELLSNPEETIGQISEQLGYNDTRSYIRFFKKFYNMTPSEWRQQHR